MRCQIKSIRLSSHPPPDCQGPRGSRSCLGLGHQGSPRASSSLDACRVDSTPYERKLQQQWSALYASILAQIVVFQTRQGHARVSRLYISLNLWFLSLFKAPTGRKRAKNASSPKPFGTGLRGTNSTSKPVEGSKMLLPPRMA